MPYSFDYAPGHITAQFSHSDFDSIDVDLRLGGEVTEITECDEEGEPLSTRTVQTSSVDCHMYVSSVWCPFRDFVRFLEAVAIGVQECAFRWDAEGPCGEMRWCDSGDRGALTVAWSSRAASFRYRCSLAKRDVLETLYSAFRTFVESPAYQPLRYERLTNGEAFEVVLEDSTANTIAETLADIAADKADAVIDRLEVAVFEAGAAGTPVRFPLSHYLGEEVRPGPEDDRSWIFENWAAMDRAQRLDRLNDFLGQDHSSWFGANLRQLRSRIVEEWLAGSR